MVYAGKPSKACERCRQRRLRCDFEKPHCRKCRLASVECPGYRNEQDLLFRNVTEEVVEKHNKVISRTQRSKPTRNSSQDDIAKFAAPEGMVAVALQFLFLCYFKGSSFEWVRGLYDRVSGDALFAKVVQAAAVAAYSYESHRVKLLAQARRAYDQALLQLRDVISTGSIDDNTLASILVMSRFETLLNDGEEIMASKSWSGHISGAFSIVQSRSDEENLGTELSYRLTEQVVRNYNLYCISVNKERPAPLIEATEKLLNKSDFISPLGKMWLRVHSLSGAFQSCRIRIRGSEPSTFTSAMATSLELDVRLSSFEQELTETSNFVVRPVDELDTEQYEIDEAHPSEHYHLYKSHQSARLWNSIRLLRLTLRWDILLRGDQLFGDKPDEPLKSALAEQNAIMLQLCTEICASAPQFLRFGVPECTHAAASFLAWPLYVAGRLDRDGCGKYVEAALAWIGQELNIKSALVASGRMAEEHNGPLLDDWLLACYSF